MFLRVVLHVTVKKRGETAKPKGQGSEAAVYRCFWKKVFLKIGQYSQENNCVGISF